MVGWTTVEPLPLVDTVAVTPDGKFSCAVGREAVAEDGMSLAKAGTDPESTASGIASRLYSTAFVIIVLIV